MLGNTIFDLRCRLWDRHRKQVSQNGHTSHGSLKSVRVKQVASVANVVLQIFASFAIVSNSRHRTGDTTANGLIAKTNGNYKSTVRAFASDLHLLQCRFGSGGLSSDRVGNPWNFIDEWRKQDYLQIGYEWVDAWQQQERWQVPLSQCANARYPTPNAVGGSRRFLHRLDRDTAEGVSGVYFHRLSCANECSRTGCVSATVLCTTNAISQGYKAIPCCNWQYRQPGKSHEQTGCGTSGEPSTGNSGHARNWLKSISRKSLYLNQIVHRLSSPFATVA